MSDTPAPPRSKNTRLIVVGLVAVALLTFFYLRSCHQPPPEPLRISHETTRLLEPRRPDGSIDYLAVIEERLGSAPAPEDNAALPLLRLVGGSAFPADDPLPWGVIKSLDAGFTPETKGTLDLDALETAWGDGDPEDFTAPVPPGVKEWVKEHQEPLRAFHAAVRRPRLHLPVVRNADMQNVIDIGTSLGLSLPLCADFGSPFVAAARVALEENRLDDAATLADSLLHLAGLLEQQPAMVPLLAAETVRSKGLAVLMRIAAHEKATRGLLIRLRGMTGGKEYRKRFIEAVDTMERYAILDYVMRSHAPDLALEPGMNAGHKVLNRITGTGLHVNVTMSRINEHLDRAVEAMRRDGFLEQQRGLAFGEEVTDRLKTLARENESLWGKIKIFFKPMEEKLEIATTFISDLMASVIISSLEHFNVVIVLANARTNVFQTAVALRLHALEHKEYPTTLEELGSSASLMDPVTGKSLEYRVDARGCIVQSLGWRVDRAGDHTEAPALGSHRKWADDPTAGDEETTAVTKLWVRLPPVR